MLFSLYTKSRRGGGLPTYNPSLFYGHALLTQIHPSGVSWHYPQGSLWLLRGTLKWPN